MVKKRVSNEPSVEEASKPEMREGVPFVLKATVIGLGVLLVVGLAVVLSTIIYRTVKSERGDNVSQRGLQTDIARRVGLDIDPGKVRSISLNGNRIAVHTDDEIIIVDYRRARVLGRISLKGGK